MSDVFEVTEADEVAATFSTEGIKTFGDAEIAVDRVMANESASVRSNVAWALWARVSKKPPAPSMKLRKMLGSFL